MKDNFFGRGQELALLDQWLRRTTESGVGMLVAIRGRRRAGKSRLVEHFARASGLPYGVVSGMKGAPLSVQMARAADSLRSSARPLAGIEPIVAMQPPSWYDLLGRLNIVLRGGPAILVLDEFPWAVQANKGLDGLLQSLWDTEFSRRPLFVVLVGSDDAMMNRLFAYDQALFGRVDDQMVVRPLNPAEVAGALGGKLDPLEVFDASLVTGGFPELVAQAREFGSTAALVEDALCRAHSPLADIAQINLAGELADSNSARSVLQAMGANEVGVMNFSAMASTLGGGKSAETAVLRATGLLQEKGIVATDLPAADGRSRLRRYRICDSYLRFWFRFIGPQLRNIEVGRSDLAVGEYRCAWPIWRGKAIEPLVRNSLLRLAPRLDDPFSAIESVEAWWDRTGQNEWDLVGTQRKGVPLAVGSVKWRERKPFGEQDFKDLARARAVVPGAEAAKLVAVTAGAVAPGVSLDLVLKPADLLSAWSAGLRKLDREPDPVQGVGAQVVVLLHGEGADDLGHQVAQPVHVGAEGLEHLRLGHPVTLVHARVGVGDQAQRRVTERQLAGQRRFRMAGHADDRPALRRVPEGLRPC
jgi:AAA+ ATPase superfamily predicted ATPase